MSHNWFNTQQHLLMKQHRIKYPNYRYTVDIPPIDTLLTLYHFAQLQPNIKLILILRSWTIWTIWTIPNCFITIPRLFPPTLLGGRVQACSSLFTHPYWVLQARIWGNVAWVVHRGSDPCPGGLGCTGNFSAVCRCRCYFFFTWCYVLFPFLSVAEPVLFSLPLPPPFLYSDSLQTSNSPLFFPSFLLIGLLSATPVFKSDVSKNFTQVM